MGKMCIRDSYNKSNNSKVRKRGENCLAKEVMTRRSADNEYFHKDFHISCDLGISYVGEHYGDDGVREYIRNYTANYLAPLSNQIREEGFQALEQYLKQLYETEKAPGVLKIRRSDDEIEVTITACPAIAFMRESGHTPSKWYIDTTTVLYETIAPVSYTHLFALAAILALLTFCLPMRNIWVRGRRAGQV